MTKMGMVTIHSSVVMMLIALAYAAFLSCTCANCVTVEAAGVTVARKVMSNISVPLFTKLAALLSFSSNRMMAGKRLPDNMDSTPIKMAIMFTLRMIFRK